MARHGRYPEELRERVIRMVLEHSREHDSEWAEITSIAGKVGVHKATLRIWVRRAQVDSGQRPGVVFVATLALTAITQQACRFGSSRPTPNAQTSQTRSTQVTTTLRSRT